MSRLIRENRTTLQKTASYYVMHIVVAAAVGYAVTGSLWMALALSMLEPTVQAVAFFVHEKVWERRIAAAKAVATVAEALPPAGAAGQRSLARA